MVAFAKPLWDCLQSNVGIVFDMVEDGEQWVRYYFILGLGNSAALNMDLIVSHRAFSCQ